ncbi:hypothetical protein BDY19DRAFT_998553 [Irpex rosettiformis]|uniref:Uncharacterized protein n=1 Tax=Irpex rosettiformis TaxID=378272 RepID=A0ACB8TNB3_9APHY|nr:hypothetical protein BDY19DRAFT_998553 [Irpex rosettiformis]
MLPQVPLATWINRVAANPFRMFSKDVATQQHRRPTHRRVRFNKQVYVAEAASAELEPWIDDSGRNNRSCCLEGEGDDDDEDLDEEEEKSIEELLAEANISEEQNALLRRRQLARGNRYGSKLTQEQGELCLVDADDSACPVNSRIMEELEVYYEPLNLNGEKPRRVNRCLSAQGAQGGRVVYDTKPILPMIPTFDQLLVDFETLGESDGPIAPPDEVAPPVFGIGLGLPSALAERRSTPHKAGPSRLLNAGSTLPEHQGLPTPAALPSTLAVRGHTSRVTTRRFQRMEDGDS